MVISIIIHLRYAVNMKRFLRACDVWLASKSSSSPLLLRIGLATVFMYAAVSSIVSPGDWISYLPHILRDHFSATALLRLFSIYELFLAVWLLSGVYVRWAGLLCAATLGGIVLTNMSLLAVTFRDVGLMCAALALAVSKEK